MVKTELISHVATETIDIYDILKSFKGGKIMVVDIEKIKQDIANLELLTAEEYCREQVEQLYADFEATKLNRIAELTTALEIIEKYQAVEEQPEEQHEEEVVENEAE